MGEEYQWGCVEYPELVNAKLTGKYAFANFPCIFSLTDFGAPTGITLTPTERYVSERMSVTIGDSK